MNNNSKRNAIGIPTILTIIFIVLKALNIIDWSWFWIISPLWITAILIFVFAIVLFIYFEIEESIDKHKSKKKHKN